MAHLDLGARHVSLKGYAGTGKTVLASRLADQLAQQGRPVHACAPTHKAAYVLSDRMPLDAATIHSFLGLQVRRDGKGGYYLAQARSKDDVPSDGVVLLDESSMVGSQLWKYISRSEGLQWVFIGDPAQLPPVKEKPSPALDVPGATLQTVVRQGKGNPILDMATAVREGARYLDVAGFNGEKGVAVTSSADSFAESALAGFKDAPKDAPPPCRILAYRNVMVHHYNDKIRHKLHGTRSLPRFVEGDWLMMKDSYFEEEIVLCKNSEEVRVSSAIVDEVCASGGFWKVWMVEVEREEGENQVLPVLHESERDRYEKTLAGFKDDAIHKRRPWRDYYDLLERFAKVDYAYAMTVHKSQGSTFHTAYVDHRDLQVCRGPEKQALTYVAVTRPSDRLALLI